MQIHSHGTRLAEKSVPNTVSVGVFGGNTGRTGSAGIGFFPPADEESACTPT